jgi:hypothetical protein
MYFYKKTVISFFLIITKFLLSRPKCKNLGLLPRFTFQKKKLKLLKQRTKLTAPQVYLITILYNRPSM